MNDVVTRFVPSMSGNFVLHIGHLITLFCNLLYAKKHRGHSYVLPSISHMGLMIQGSMREIYSWAWYGTTSFQMLGIAEEDIIIIPLFPGGLSFRKDLINKVKDATGIEDLKEWEDVSYSVVTGAGCPQALMVAMTDFIIGTNVIIRGRDWHPDNSDASSMALVGSHARNLQSKYVSDHLSFLRRFRTEADQNDEIREYFAPLVTYGGEKISKSWIDIEDPVVIFRTNGMITPVDDETAPKDKIPGIAYLAWMMEMCGSPAKCLDDIMNYLVKDYVSFSAKTFLHFLDKSRSVRVVNNVKQDTGVEPPHGLVQIRNKVRSIESHRQHSNIIKVDIHFLNPNASRNSFTCISHALVSSWPFFMSG